MHPFWGRGLSVAEFEWRTFIRLNFFRKILTDWSTQQLGNFNIDPMNICSGFSSETVNRCGDLPAYETISLSFSEAARLSADDALTVAGESCPIDNTGPYNFMIPAIQMFGSISRWVE